MKYIKNKYARFAVVATIYTLWVIWVGVFWLLIGLGVIFDMYVTQKVNWSPWKKREGKNHFLIEWLDAIIFFFFSVTIIHTFLFQNYKIPTGSMENSMLIGDHLYVSKVAYGPKIPETPLSLPLMQNTIFGTTKKSYLEWVKWPYKRLKGLREVKRNDIVVFNCPALDSVAMSNPTFSYRHEVQQIAEYYRTIDLQQLDTTYADYLYWKKAEQYLLERTEMVTRPVDRRDNYIKRCVGIPGDSLYISNSQLFINGKPAVEYPGQLQSYDVYLNQPFSRRSIAKLRKIGIENSNMEGINNKSLRQTIHLNKEQAEQLVKYKNVERVTPIIRTNDYHFNFMFPYDPSFNWSEDNFGPIYIPKKGATVDLTLENLPIYRRIINAYEGNTLKVKDSTIYINDKASSTYTFKMDYYWMMGDNRHSSWDSRSWGYVPEDHIVGRPVFVWLSVDKSESFPKSIRFNRFFKFVK